MATFQLRLRGTTPLHFAAAAISAMPLGFVTYQVIVHQAILSTPLVLLSGAVLLLPWLSRAAARASYRAKCDEVAIHVRGEALPYRTITNVVVERSPRRTLLRLQRGETIELQLILKDAFAGRLEPFEELARRLATHGHVVSRE
jgi:hypothetical protein